jgi:RNA polymerase sigma factor (sigma-70 family)
VTSPPDDRPENHVRWAMRLALGIVRAQGAFDRRKDAVQEACLAMSLAWARYDPTRGTFEEFAKKRVAGAVRRSLQQGRRWRALEVALEGDEAPDEPGDPWARATRAARERMGEIATTYHLAAEVERLDRGEEVIEELRRLDPEELKLIDLIYRRDLPGEQVASGLGIKERAARYRHAKLLEKLRAALQRHRT